MSDLASRIESLSPEKRALLEQRLLQRRELVADDAIPRRAASGPVPLSFSQQRLWFLDQWSPGSPVYNAAVPMRIRGPIDVEALRVAFEGVIRRHEALRTVFVVEGSEPVQTILDEWTFDLPVVDVRELDPDEPHSALGSQLRKRSRRAFDLRRDLMLRGTLFRLAADDHVLLIEQHHIAFDGWSDGVLFHELSELYHAQLTGGPADLLELPIQYADFAVWQRQRMQGPLLEQQLAYWRAQLGGSPAMLRLRTDFPRPPVQSFEGVHLELKLSREVADGVRSLSREQKATPFMTLLSVFTTLLYRITGQDDIVVGTPIANRNRVELENLIGFFSNTVPIRVRLGGNPTVIELIQRVRESAVGAYTHQDLPFERIVEAARPSRDAAVNPLFQVNFRVESGERETLRLTGLEVTPVRVDLGLSRFDLALELRLRDDGIDGYLELNTDLFERKTGERLCRDFEALLADALDRPDARLLELDLPTRSGAAAHERPRIRGADKKRAAS